MANRFAPMLEDFAAYGTARLQFRPRITCVRTGVTPIDFTAKEIENRVNAEWGRTFYCESLRPSTKVKPFFDFDLYLAEEPSAAALRTYENTSVATLQAALDLETDEPIAVATSHGAVSNREGFTFKVSIRFYVQGFWIKAGDLAAFMAARPSLVKSATSGWDNSVYPNKSERLLRVVGAIKGSGDSRVLEPLEPGRPYHHYVVQSLIGNELPLPSLSGPLPKRPRLDQRDALVRHAWVPPENEMELLGLQLMKKAGMTTGYRIDATQLNVLKFMTIGERHCVFGGVHSSNSCAAVFEQSGEVHYVCHGTDCKGKIHVLGTWRTTLDQLVAADALTPAQMATFHPSVIKAMEEACMAAAVGKAKLEECPDFPVYLKHAMAYFNRFFAHIHTSRPEVVQKYLDDDGNILTFERRVAPATAEVVKPAGAIFNIWMNHLDKVNFRGYGFHPDPEEAAKSPELFNLCNGVMPFRHVAVRPLTEAEAVAIKPLFDHAMEVFCGNDQLLFDYLMNWVAAILQHPGRKNNSAIVLTGPQGTGKSMFFSNLMGKLFGGLFRLCSSSQELLTQFNESIATRVLITCDEAGFFGGFREQANRLKGLITEPTITLEKKGKDSVVLPSFINLLLCTNEAVPVRLDQDDRRWAVYKVSSAHANNQAYFAKLHDIINTPALVMAIYLWFMNRDVSDYNPRAIPNTAAKEEMQLAHRSTVDAFLQHVCMHPDVLELGEVEPMPVFSSRLYPLYRTYVDAQPSHVKPVEQRQLVQELKAMGLVNQTLTIRGENARGFRLPPRPALEATLRAAKKWDKDQE